MTIFGTHISFRQFVRTLAEFAVFVMAMAALCAWLVIIHDFVNGV